jgi:hypothetical protein
MDYFTFTERLKLTLSHSTLSPELTKEVKGFLEEGSSTTKCKLDGIKLLKRLMRESSDLVLDLYRDLLPELIHSLLDSFKENPSADNFLLISKIFNRCSAFRPAITSAFSLSDFNPSEVLLSYPDSAEPHFLNLLKALHYLISVSEPSYITGLWDCSGFIQRTVNAPNNQIIQGLLLSVSLRILGYSIGTIEDFLGKSLALQVEAYLELPEHKMIQAHPFVLEVTSKDTFIANTDISENSVYSINGNKRKDTAEFVFTHNLKRLYKTLSQLIIHDPSKPILLVGAQGTGKTSLIEQLSSDRKDTNLIQIYMDETLDVKSLVGTFVCAES